jgi:pyruvate,orthophosphate dikinase
MVKWVYSFGEEQAEGRANMKDLLGGKGANLAEMCRVGLPVPPGFTISTEACHHFYQNNEQLPDALLNEIQAALKAMEGKLKCEFGSETNPLLVSVRSGARASMPGMMDTVLNLGLNDQTVQGLIAKTQNERFAYDSYRRFIQMYSNVVLGIEHYVFEELLEQKKHLQGIIEDTDLTASDLRELVSEYKKKVQEELNKPFPEDVQEQLVMAIKAVFGSWMNARAKTYRKLNNIPESWGTAVNIQSMVFGNMGDDSATGVAFTRDPSTGEKLFYGEYLINAQGEDVVAGIRTPQPITKLARVNAKQEGLSLEEAMPDVFAQLEEYYQKLEKHYLDMQDIEFTVQNNRLWILQTRSGKRSAQAAIKIATDMVKEGLISKEEAIRRINPLSLDQLLHPTIDASAKCQIIAKGLPASPGAACGMVVFSSEEAEKRAKQKVILVRIETSPEDIHGMHASQGILTTRGGMTSHAAVVARGMGKPCVCGAASVIINYEHKTLTVGKVVIKEGEVITINGSTGEIILGEVPTIAPQLSPEFNELMGWADQMRHLKVRANAETPLDAATAVKFGAEGIGLCRTEHMFFSEDRITAVREMIIAESSEVRKEALKKILPMQRQDFVELFAIMKGLPVNIRLLDPPLHEFLPHSEKDMQQVAEVANVPIEVVKRCAHKLTEMNPMLGHRGCRLGISYPEIYEMQAQAIFEAMIEASKAGHIARVEIMIPLILSAKELDILKKLINKVAALVAEKAGVILDYQIGTMIELPRAALMAGEIAHFADYFSFGTNDLTQTTCGISRDDSGSFLPTYCNEGIFGEDPFVQLDEEGVGELIKIAAERGRNTKPNLKLGICGEHAGHPKSIDFCQRAGLDYISCSPYRVPIARLAAAQAALRHRK